ncbi:hypothetical protein M9458_022383, partial [Cirrhinus mrigala]
LPEMPGLRWKEEYEAAILFQHLSLWDALPYTHEVRSLLNPDFTLRSRNTNSEKFNIFTLKPFKSQFPVNMENLPVNNGNGQAYGYTLYETAITRGGSLKSGRNIQDRALVSADKKSSSASVYEHASALFSF